MSSFKLKSVISFNYFSFDKSFLTVNQKDYWLRFLAPFEGRFYFVDLTDDVQKLLFI